jgi:hypothetical protein
VQNTPHRYAATLFLTAALAGPMSVMAAPRPAADQVTVRVYDTRHHDYHNWDDAENRRWGIYLKENYRDYHDFQKANRREHERYWVWRHSHPD